MSARTNRSLKLLFAWRLFKSATFSPRQEVSQSSNEDRPPHPKQRQLPDWWPPGGSDNQFLTIEQLQEIKEAALCSRPLMGGVSR